MKRDVPGECDRSGRDELARRYLTTEQCAAYIGRTEKAVYHLVAERRIPFRRLPGRRLVFDRVAIDRWIEGAPGPSIADALAAAEIFEQRLRLAPPQFTTGVKTTAGPRGSAQAMGQIGGHLSAATDGNS